MAAAAVQHLLDSQSNIVSTREGCLCRLRKERVAQKRLPRADVVWEATVVQHLVNS